MKDDYMSAIGAVPIQPVKEPIHTQFQKDDEHDGPIGVGTINNMPSADVPKPAPVPPVPEPKEEKSSLGGSTPVPGGMPGTGVPPVPPIAAAGTAGAAGGAAGAAGGIAAGAAALGPYGLPLLAATQGLDLVKNLMPKPSGNVADFLVGGGGGGGGAENGGGLPIMHQFLNALNKSASIRSRV